MAQIRQSRGYRAGQTSMIETLPSIDGHEHGRAHPGEHPLELTATNSRDHRGEDGTKPGSRDVHGTGLPPVRQLHGHDLPLADAELTQCTGKSLHHLRVPTVGEGPALPVRGERIDGHRVGCRVTPPSKITDQSGFPPPAIGAVSLCQLGRRSQRCDTRVVRRHLHSVLFTQHARSEPEHAACTGFALAPHRRGWMGEATRR